ncbi:MAG: mucoidy inhibitor MuiA family protein [Opitutaceae bacterium]|nr:mucoidy inhibitor MuiA family protein [Opitutaceae bacterium]
MNRLRLSSLLVALLFAPVALVAADLASRITAVTVYTDRAVVTRSATAELAPGITELVFPELPSGLQDQSLQVSGSGTAAATILDVTSRQTYLAVTPDPRRHDLENQIKALQQDDRALADRQELLRGRSDLINRLQTSAVSPGAGEKSERPKLEDVKGVLDYGQTQLAEIAAALRELEIKRALLQDEIAALQNQLNDLRSPGRRSVKAVTVRVQAETAGTLDLALSYTVGGAGWTPGYNARVVSGERAVQLAYFGNVRQNTGEDWTDVALTLSTARPSLGGAAPELNPWHLDIEERVQLSPFMVMSETDAPAARDMAYAKQESNARERAGLELRQAAAMAQATVESGTTSATFKIAVPASIASDNSAQKVPITEVLLEADSTYATTPKLRETAFLNAKVINTSDYPLLAGAMNVFLDSSFVATSRLGTTMPGEKFDLALGADEGIGVKYERIKRFAEQTGMFSKDNRISYEYRITIENKKRMAVRVIVSDQVPVSRNEKIVVKVQAPPEKEAKPDAEGKLQWTLNLQPGEKRELTVKFTVDYPKDVEVTGLE